MNIGEIKIHAVDWRPPEKFTCPHCGFGQKVRHFLTDLQTIEVRIFQCLECSMPTVTMKLFDGGDTLDKMLYPTGIGRRITTYRFCDPEVFRIYAEACDLSGVSSSAAGAFARKSVELMLEKLGYEQQWLAQKITAAVAETDPDKRLPKRIIQRLKYLAEAGNFGIHIRRNTTTSEIVEVEPIEVEACLDTVEEMIQEIFELPGEDAERTAAMNEKLAAAGKKTI